MSNRIILMMFGSLLRVTATAGVIGAGVFLAAKSAGIPSGPAAEVGGAAFLLELLVSTLLFLSVRRTARRAAATSR